MIEIEKLNECLIRLNELEVSQKKEIEDYFSYKEPAYIPNKQYFMYLKRRRMKVPLFNISNSTLPIGLLPNLIMFLKKANYGYIIKGNFNTKEFTKEDALEFIKTLNIPKKFTIRDYQLEYFISAVRNQRAVLISPTNSGKSLCMYLIFRYFNQKTLITVPNSTLVYQLENDFKEYGYKKEIHTITSGSEKSTDKFCTISTWQSIFTQNRNYFEHFKVVLGDECHTNRGSSLIKIMNMMINTPIRIGLTGTMSDVELYNKQIQGLFGPIIKHISQHQLIEQGYSSPLIIKNIILNHNLEILSLMDWEDEIPLLLSSVKRNDFIVRLACSLNNNSFVMFRNINHGKYLYEKIKEKSMHPVYYVDGKTSIENRENLRKIIENSKNSITIASLVFNAGINITTISNLILSHPSKSRIRLLQAIGRGLRVHNKKDHLTIYDISDKLCKNINNTTYKHFLTRKKIYKQEKFETKEHLINL